MRFLTVLTLLFALFSCASKPIPLTVHEYDVKDAAKLTVNFLKDKSDRLDIGLLGISAKEDAVVIKKEEMGCGKGTEVGTITKFGKVTKEPFIILPKSMFLEFYLVCKNPNFKITIGKPYIEIKHVYTLTNGLPGKVVASDIKLELK